MSERVPLWRVAGTIASMLLAMVLAFGMGYVFGEKHTKAEQAARDDAAGPGDRRADPETGCDAIAAGIRTLTADTTTQPSELRAVLLDQLLTNHRATGCGLKERTRLLLGVVGVGKS